jgi:hypothetical protein
MRQQLKAEALKLQARLEVQRGRNKPMFCLRGFAPSRETEPC